MSITTSPAAADLNTTESLWHGYGLDKLHLYDHRPRSLQEAAFCAIYAANLGTWLNPDDHAHFYYEDGCYTVWAIAPERFIVSDDNNSRIDLLGLMTRTSDFP